MAKRVLTALTETLLNLGQPAVSGYEVFCHTLKLYAARSYQGEKLLTHGTDIPPGALRRLMKALFTQGTLRLDSDFPGVLYRIKDTADLPAEEICALADPFCYLSHLSAMQRYGLTNRFPQSLCLTTPERRLWQQQAREKMQADCGPEAFEKETFVPLAFPAFPAQVRGRPVSRHITKCPVPARPIRDAHARIASIGWTFHDMLAEPALCGGMAHVLEVWQEHAAPYLEEIIPVVTQASSKIVQVRAGYILEERLGIQDPRILVWQSAAQRGGSRVLDPQKPFIPAYSEKWMLSINVTST